METYTGDAYCVKCKEKVDFKGQVKVSDSGRRMAQGKCPKCGTQVNRILGKESGWIGPGCNIETSVNLNILKPIIGEENKAANILAAQIGDPNDAKSRPIAERILKLLIEIDPDIVRLINKWDADREERKQEKRWKRRFAYELDAYLDEYAGWTPLNKQNYERNTILVLRERLRDKYANL